MSVTIRNNTQQNQNKPIKSVMLSWCSCYKKPTNLASCDRFPLLASVDKVHRYCGGSTTKEDIKKVIEKLRNE